MILSTVIDLVTARIAARSRRQAMDWSLVLISQDIESTVDFNEEGGWGLTIAEKDHESAIKILKQYHAENRQWRWRDGPIRARYFPPGDRADLSANGTRADQDRVLPGVRKRARRFAQLRSSGDGPLLTKKKSRHSRDGCFLKESDR